MVYQKEEWQTEWDENKSEIKIKLSELGLYKEYEPEVIQAALMEFLVDDFRSDLKEKFGEKYNEKSE
jgi:hypothetical protein